MQDIKDKIATSKVKRQRRKTIPDECITLEQYKNILSRICECIMLDENELNQKNIIRIALKYSLSNNMIANIVNYLLPDAKATSGSIASMLKFLRRQQQSREDLARQIEDMLNE